MADYTDQAAVETYLGKTLTADPAAWIAAVSAFIDKYTGRTFVTDEAPSERLFEGNSGQKLIIDDCIDVTKVEIGDRYGDNFEETTDYQAFPLNETPKTMLGLKNRGWGVGIHRITANWGYSASRPDDIAFAATVLVAGIANFALQTGSAIKSETIGNYSVSYDTAQGAADYERAMAILDSYRRITI